jgi:hypothetical protein
VTAAGASAGECYIPPMGRTVDLAGLRFGKLVALTMSPHKTTNGQRRWRCVCDCGGVTSVGIGSLRSGGTKSCGCLKREETVARCTKHGWRKRGTHRPEYMTWLAIKERCYNPNTDKFSNYGGRGIRVCDRWLESFENFIADMGLRPGGIREYSIERIDSNGNYEPANCRWATQREQCNNISRNCRIEHAGRSLTLQQWSRETGVKRETIARRLNQGWAPARAITEPVDGKFWANRERP